MTQNQINYQKNLETERHNKATEGQERLNLQETLRSNVVRELETKRSNLENEAIKRQQNAIAQGDLDEVVRHNQAYENHLASTLAEERRHNVSIEGETQRHNVQQEYLGWGQLNESIRHNTSTESETQRHNVQQENLGWSNLQEVVRHNKSAESIAWDQNSRSWAALNETIRHNQADESISSTSNALAAARNNLAGQEIQMRKYIADLQNEFNRDQLALLEDYRRDELATENAREWVLGGLKAIGDVAKGASGIGSLIGGTQAMGAIGF